MSISKFWSDAFGQKGIGGRGASCPSISSDSKNDTRTRDFQSNDTALKFIWFISSIKNHVYPRGMASNTYSWVLGGCVDPGVFVIMSLNYF